ncbi:hypothetical protein SAMN05216256_10183 [Halopseudomonas pachastrellae]|nr:hypothetical protein SAMN05216256_10183 [Halopseudomonas pachastrellae]
MIRRICRKTAANLTLWGVLFFAWALVDAIETAFK